MKACFACGAMEAESHSKLESFHVDEFCVRRCNMCNSLSTRPLPSAESLASHYANYNEGYVAGMGMKRYMAEMPKRWAARLRLLEQRGDSGSLLDVGGSNGMFGALAHRRGFRVSIADFISKPKDLGFTTAVPGDMSQLGGVPFADAHFDAVTLWSCLEHVRDPESCLKELHRLVRPGGIVAIDTPLVGDVCERLYPARSHWIGPPEHLHLFSAMGLDRAVRRVGFEPLFHSRFYERTRVRWLARRGRNVAMASAGLALRIVAREKWGRLRQQAVTQAGDIQVLICRRPGQTSAGDKGPDPAGKSAKASPIESSLGVRTGSR